MAKRKVDGETKGMVPQKMISSGETQQMNMEEKTDTSSEPIDETKASEHAAVQDEKPIFTPGIDNLRGLFMAMSMDTAEFNGVADGLLSKTVPPEEVGFWREELDRIRKLPEVDHAVRRFAFERSNDAASTMLTTIIQEMVVSTSLVTKKAREMERAKAIEEMSSGSLKVEKEGPASWVEMARNLYKK